MIFNLLNTQLVVHFSSSTELIFGADDLHQLEAAGEMPHLQYEIKLTRSQMSGDIKRHHQNKNYKDKIRLLIPYGISGTYKPTNMLRTKWIKPKGPLYKMEQSAMIYSIDYMNCIADNVEETEKKLGSRFRERRCAVTKNRRSGHI